jgi:Spy/CpxP family protein refolding chaperone
MRAAMTQIFWRRVQERVALTGQQLTDIHPLLQAQRTAARADVQGLFTARKKLRTLLGQPTTDLGAIQSAAAQVKSRQAELFDQRLQTQLALRSKLTPEHLACWIELRKDRGHHGMRHGHAFGPGAV